MFSDRLNPTNLIGIYHPSHPAVKPCMEKHDTLLVLGRAILPALNAGDIEVQL